MPFQGVGPLVNTFIAITHLGDARIVAIVGISMALVLLRHKRYSYAIGLGISIFGALFSSYALKLFIARPRPLDSLIEIAGYSFPSMHAASSLALYGFLMYLTYRLMRPDHHRMPWMFVLLAILLLIGYSRIYLGVHFASDVFAGFALGAFWVWIGYLAQNKLDRK